MISRYRIRLKSYGRPPIIRHPRACPGDPWRYVAAHLAGRGAATGPRDKPGDDEEGGSAAQIGGLFTEFSFRGCVAAVGLDRATRSGTVPLRVARSAAGHDAEGPCAIPT